MRAVVLYTLTSLDGVAEEPGDWMFDVDDDIVANLARVVSTQTDVLLGRGTYDDWCGYWPRSDVQPFADFVNTTPKHVFTGVPPENDWPKTTFVTGPAVGHVRELKRQGNGDIGVHGSIRLAQSLLAADEIDRLELVVAPSPAGRGRRLFTDTVARLRLVDVGRNATGAAFLTYTR